MIGDRPENRYEARRWLAALATFLLLARALVPTGYMPDFTGADAGLRFVVCHAGEPSEIPASPGRGETRVDSCPFASLAHGGLLAAALLFWNQLAIAPIRRSLKSARRKAARWINPKPIGARAPPVSFS